MSGILVIFSIIQIAFQEIEKFVNNQDVRLADALTRIAQAVVIAYQKETGQPLDLSKIPPETPVT